MDILQRKINSHNSLEFIWNNCLYAAHKVFSKIFTEFVYYQHNFLPDRLVRSEWVKHLYVRLFMYVCNVWMPIYIYVNDILLSPPGLLYSTQLSASHSN